MADEDFNDGAFDSPLPIGSFPVKTLIGFLTGFGNVAQTNRDDVTEQLASSDLRRLIKREEGINDEQLRQVLKFELLRQDDDVSGRPLRDLYRTLHKQDKENKSAIAEGKKPPHKPLAEYINDNAYTRDDKGGIKPKVLDVSTLDRQIYKDRGMSMRDIAYLLEREEIPDVVDEFKKHPQTRTMLARHQAEEKKQLEEARKTIPLVDAGDEAILRKTLGLEEKTMPTAQLLFAEQVLSLARKNELVVLPENMTFPNPNSLVIEGSEYALKNTPVKVQKNLEAEMGYLKEQAADYGSSLNLTVERLPHQEEGLRFPRARMRIEGDAIYNAAFLQKMLELLQAQESERAGGINM